ncbi:MAG: HD domain-containing protein [Bacteroidales bacterium]|nr:HD domain-containing protein [Bacteroidales bacterium]
MKQRIINLLNRDIFHIISDCSNELNVDCYVVGGFVRDFFLQRTNHDIDIVVVGNGIEFAKTVVNKIGIPEKNIVIFKNYGTAMFHYQGLDIEFVGARKESYTKSSRNPTVEQGSLLDDQNRRDFTINAMAIGLSKENYGELVDPFNGLDDLKHKTIRTPLDPDITFSDDPLRIMRAIRFSTQLNFAINQTTLLSIIKQSERIKIVSNERIVEEINKILLSKKPSIGFQLMDVTDVLPKVLPWVSDLKGVDIIKGSAHKDNFYHTLEVLDKIAENSSNLWLRWAALLHDIGKPKTKKFINGIGWTFHQHELVGAKMVVRIFRELRLPLNEKMEYVKKLVYLHLRPIALIEDDVTDSAVRRLLFDAGDDIDDLMLMCEADVTSKNPHKVRRLLKNFENVRLKLKEIEEKDRIRNFQPPISGEIIMKEFNLQPCREVGIIKNAIREAILDGIIPNEYEAAYRYMISEANKIGIIKNK